MAYAVDFVLDVMKKISSSEPVLFQRDGSLYISSTEGFGQVTYGLCARPEKIEPWEKRRQPPAIAESTDAIKEWVGDWDKKPKFIKGEGKYLQAIAFGPDTDEFTLEDITKAAQQLGKLLDDGKIRMILHGSSYHSHKYGYAADGIDVHVLEARVMDRNRYLELVREEEDKLVQAMERVGEVKDRRDGGGSYEKLKIPDCVIITPYLIVSLPRDGRLHRDEPDLWTQHTRMKSNYSGSTKGSILNHKDVSMHDESPFRAYFTLNARKLQGANEKELKSSGEELVTRVNKQLSAVTSSMPMAQEFLERLNGVHNKIFAPDIEWKKRLRSERRASAPFLLD